jgi:hypothetical protein
VPGALVSAPIGGSVLDMGQAMRGAAARPFGMIMTSPRLARAGARIAACSQF